MKTINAETALPSFPKISHKPAHNFYCIYNNKKKTLKLI